MKFCSPGGSTGHILIAEIAIFQTAHLIHVAGESETALKRTGVSY